MPSHQAGNLQQANLAIAWLDSMPLAALPALVLSLALALFHVVGPVPADLGVRQGSLSACTTPAHCARVDWRVADPEQALLALLPVIEATPRTQVLEQAGGYLHATASSALFGFVDDLELYADRERGLLQARSVSRLGDSDLGVNARRLQGLADQLKD
jgi:uncharacterized protein (DUF1499 family)